MRFNQYSQFAWGVPFEHAQQTSGIDDDMGSFVILRVSFASLAGMQRSGLAPV